MINIFAHRGLWRRFDQQNTEDSVIKALTSGFFVELDLRQDNGVLGVGHDAYQEFDFDLAFKNKDVAYEGLYLALHVKEEGLLTLIKEAVSKFNKKLKFFIFGVSQNEWDSYLGEFGADKVAFELYGTSDDATYQQALNYEGKWIWYAELTQQSLEDSKLKALKEAGKKLVLVTPDCLNGESGQDFKLRSVFALENEIDVCTDCTSAFTDFYEGKWPETHEDTEVVKARFVEKEEEVAKKRQEIEEEKSKRYIFKGDKKYEYKFIPVSETSTRVVCEAAELDQVFEDSELKSLVKNLPNMIKDED